MKSNIILLIILFPVLIYSQSADKVLAEIQSKFKTIHDFKADFIQTAKQDSKTNAFKNEGVFYYKKNNKFRIEFGPQIIISDNESLWNYDKRQNRVLINIVEDNPSSFSFENYILEYPSRCKVLMISDGNNPGDYGVQLIPLDLDLEFNSVKLWSNKENIVNKIELVDLNDMIITIELNNIRINQKLPDSKFTFTPPKGSQIIDLR